MNDDTILGVLVVGGKPVPVRKRDWVRVQSHAVVMASGCHVVDYATCCRAGHRQMRVSGKKVLVHRLAYAATHGGIPAGLIVRHRCDNPRCVNPAHLEAGTQADNIQDMVSRGRANFTGRQKLTDADIRRVFELKADGWTQLAIAKEVGCTQAYVWRLLNRKTNRTK